jgi:hypothetical protein
MSPAPALVLLVLAAAASPARAPSPEVREQARALLGAIHGPVRPETFRALGPGVEDALAEVARGSGMPSRRVAALDALAGLGGPLAEEVHREVASSATAPTAVRRGAVRGLGRLLAPAAATGALGPMVEADRDPAIRAAAAEALARAAPAEGCARVRARARVDPEGPRFQRALDRCDRSGQAAPPSR